MARFCARAIMRVAVLLLTFSTSAGHPALGHEIRPALLRITERAHQHYDFLWKQPSMGTVSIHLVPHISGGLLERDPDSLQIAFGSQIRLWRDIDAGVHGLEGRTLRIDGLDRTITDVLVILTLANGDSIQHVLHSQRPSLTLHSRSMGMGSYPYLALGIEHILEGIDHLSFVLALILLVRQPSVLFKTISAFTIAHSLTLAGTTLHVMMVQPRLTEALVALSILFVAVELIHHYRGQPGLTVRYPWVIAFTFGLLHGSAFAGALVQVGLPPNAIPSALLLFNIGVEVGQFMFIAVVLSIGWLLRQFPRQLPDWTRWLPPYAIGSLAAFWLVDRVNLALN